MLDGDRKFPDSLSGGVRLSRPGPHCFGSIAMLKARQCLTEILRMLPGSSLVMAPADTDLAAPEMAAGLKESFGGGGYAALQPVPGRALKNFDSGSTELRQRSGCKLRMNDHLPGGRSKNYAALWAGVYFS
jgi:hypothetical protein